MWTGTWPHYTISREMRAPLAVVVTAVRTAVVVSVVASVVALALVAETGVSAQSTRRPVSLVVIGGSVITENPSHQVLSPGAVAIDGTSILDVDTPANIAARYTSAQTIDASDQIVLPGLINTHGHAPMALYRGQIGRASWRERV